MALRKGFQQSSGEIIVSIDADLSYHPNYIIDFVETLRTEQDIDFVLASPYMPGEGFKTYHFVACGSAGSGTRF